MNLGPDAGWKGANPRLDLELPSVWKLQGEGVRLFYKKEEKREPIQKGDFKKGFLLLLVKTRTQTNSGSYAEISYIWKKK